MIKYLAIVRPNCIGEVLKVADGDLGRVCDRGKGERKHRHRRIWRPKGRPPRHVVGTSRLATVVQTEASMKRQRLDDFRRINQTAIDLFRLGKEMLAQGFSDSSTEFYEVSLGLHRALGLKPWQLEIFDFELFTMQPTHPPHVGFELVHDLHRRLVAAT